MFVVGMVNYKTSVYMETQFKIYEKFAGEDYKIIIADTSNNAAEFGRLQQIAAQFSAMPIELVQINATGKYGSEGHGFGLQHVYNMIKEDDSVQYYLTQDPDFFWVMPNFLTHLKDKLQEYVVVGAPYCNESRAGWSGHPWFPAATGAAHRMEDLRKIDADFQYTPGRPPGFEEVEIVMDVGWRIRKELAHLPYYTFDQVPFEPIKPYSFDDWKASRQYFSDGESIAYHLCLGSFEMDARKGYRWTHSGRSRQKRLAARRVPTEWVENRKKMCEFFWNEARRNNERGGFYVR